MKKFFEISIIATQQNKGKFCSGQGTKFHDKLFSTNERGIKFQNRRRKKT